VGGSNQDRQVSRKGYSKQVGGGKQDKHSIGGRQNKQVTTSKYSQDRTKLKNSSAGSKCPVSHLCGGCNYVDEDYVRQLEIKQGMLDELLGKYAPVDKIEGMDNPYNYRNKVTAEFHRQKNGEVISGVYQEGTHKVFPVDYCYIENEKARAIIKDVAGLVRSFKLPIYDEDKGSGLLRHVQVRVGKNTGQIMVIIVTASPVFPSKKNLAKALLKLHPEITTIIQNINTKNTTMVIGERNQTIYGKGYIEDILCGKKFRISPGSFYQVNPVQTEVLYRKAVKYADLKENQVAIDAYCGIGTIGIVASENAGKVIGVELNPAAVRDARTNVKLNNIDNVDIYSNDAGRFMVDLAEQGETVDTVFMDPPRSGSTKEFMSSVTKLSPRRLIYISCNPHSLARDLEYLTHNGYKVLKISPIDMFPLTEGIEAVALLVSERRERRSN
jgi:23S rRNA (uracil1939-C5)-methyltransferase